MSEFEDKVSVVLKGAGWKILHKGWPDFLCYRDSEDGSKRVACIEIKAHNDFLKEEQILNHSLLLGAGMPVYVVKEDMRFLDGVNQRHLSGLLDNNGTKNCFDQKALVAIMAADSLERMAKRINTLEKNLLSSLETFRANADQTKAVFEERFARYGKSAESIIQEFRAIETSLKSLCEEK